MNETFMKEKPIFPLLLGMGMPVVLSMLVNSLYNIVDSYFVARIMPARSPGGSSRMPKRPPFRDQMAEFQEDDADSLEKENDQQDAPQDVYGGL